MIDRRLITVLYPKATTKLVKKPSYDPKEILDAFGVEYSTFIDGDRCFIIIGDTVVGGPNIYIALKQAALITLSIINNDLSNHKKRKTS